jgi:CRISPR-associated protein Cmr3
MSALTCRFTAFDTWFFREARPQGSIGQSELSSVFPPPINTLLGAVRTAVGDEWHTLNGTSWREFHHLKELQALIGFGDDLGPLRCNGPYISLDGERLYPAPAHLLRKDDTYFLLGLGDPVMCDLGKVHLPIMPTHVHGLANLAGAKTLDTTWLTQAGLLSVLSGKAPQSSQVRTASDLFINEPRIGIGRDNQRSAVREGLLYQTRHLRLQPNVAVEIDLFNLSQPDLLAKGRNVRLGGEGRLANLSVTDTQTAPLNCDSSPSVGELVCLVNMTAAETAPGLPLGIPPGFCAKQDEHGVTTWTGELQGLRLNILSVACSRPLREGGWDLAQHQSRPVRSWLAPGSVLFARVNDGSHFVSSGDAFGRNQWLLSSCPISTAARTSS